MPDDSKRILGQLNGVMEHLARNAYVNCWHMNRNESIAMWQYGQGEYGIALRSNFGQLCRAFHAADRDIHVGMVTYGPDESEEFHGSTRKLVLRKGPCWDWERELRAVAHVRREEWSDDRTLLYGVAIKVDLNELIESVYVAPTAPAWFATLAQALMRRYGFLQPVIPSDLLREPSWALARAK